MGMVGEVGRGERGRKKLGSIAGTPVLLVVIGTWGPEGVRTMGDVILFNILACE